uniref:3-keto-5-aminohexanoate cleavage enzyme n=1 Tax=Arcella intermedia TaxID=1963864 RepID=A0A6B2LAA6_9EUKA
MITAALTGDVPMKNRHMNVPITPKEIVRDACEVFEAGARMIHVHVRDEEGRPTCKAQYYGEVLEGVRKACPEMIVQFSTGNYAPNLQERVECFKLPTKPDMGSWTPGSVNFLPARKGSDIYWNTNEDIESIIKLFKETGIRPDVAIFDASMLYRTHLLYQLGWISPPVRLMFVFGGYMALPPRAPLIRFLVSECEDLFGPGNWSWCGVGVGWNHSQLQRLTLEHGGHPRTGFEDSFLIQRRVIAKNNRQLVEHLVQLCGEYGRPIATPAEARELLGLNVPINTDTRGLTLPTDNKAVHGWSKDNHQYYTRNEPDSPLKYV